MKRTKKLSPLEVTEGRVTITIYPRRLPSGNIQYRVDNRRLTGGFISCKTEEGAMEEARRLAQRIEAGETNAAALSNKDAMDFVLCSDAVKPFGLTVGEVTHWMTRALKTVGDIGKLNEALNFYSTHHRKITNKTVKEAVDKLLERKKHRSDRHISSLKSVLNRFADSFACNIGDVTTPQVQTYLDKCDFESERTYHNHWSKINQLFLYSTKQDFCMHNIADKVERADLEDGEVGIYTPEEITKLLAAATPEFLPCMAIGAFAGLRSAELERLDWSCIHWPDREFFLDRKVTKTGYSRTVPIHDNLMAWLTPFKDRKGKVWKGTTKGYYDAQSDIAKAAGVAWVHNGLRHSYGSYRFRVLNGDVTTVSAEMGNSRAMVQKHYKRLVKQSDSVSWFAVQPEQAPNIVGIGATK